MHNQTTQRTRHNSCRGTRSSLKQDDKIDIKRLCDAVNRIKTDDVALMYGDDTKATPQSTDPDCHHQYMVAVNDCMKPKKKQTDQDAIIRRLRSPLSAAHRDRQQKAHVSEPDPATTTVSTPNWRLGSNESTLRSNIRHPRTLKINEMIAVASKPPHLRTRVELTSMQLTCREYQAFTDFSDLMVREICGVSYIERCNAYTNVYCTGEEGTNWYVIVQGQVQIIVPPDIHSGKTRNEIRRAAVGESFGDIGLLHDRPRTETVRTMEPSVFFRIEKSDYVRKHHIHTCKMIKLPIK
jgi:hypothetical protein